MLDNIKNLYNKVDSKKNFNKIFSEYIGKSENTLKNHWFMYFSIPVEYQEKTVTFLQKYIRNQNHLNNIEVYYKDVKC